MNCNSVPSALYRRVQDVSITRQATRLLSPSLSLFSAALSVRLSLFSYIFRVFLRVYGHGKLDERTRRETETEDKSGR